MAFCVRVSWWTKYETTATIDSLSLISLCQAPHLFYAHVSHSFVLRVRLYLCCSASTKTIELLEIYVLSTKLSQKYFDTLKFKIRGVCNLTFSFLSDTVWWPISAKSCFTFLNFLNLFIHLIFCPVLYAIDYFRFIILYIIISSVYKKNLIIP